MNKRPHFKEVYNEFHIKVRSILFSLTKTENIDDLVQEVFIKIWKNLDGFRGDAKLSTWIYQITTRTAYDYFRKEKRHRHSSGPELDKISVVSDEAKIDNQNLIKYALEQLSVEHKVVVALHYLEGFNLDEIALIEHISSGTVKSRLFYAKKKLHKFFLQHGVEL